MSKRMQKIIAEGHDSPPKWKVSKLGKQGK